MHNVRVELMRLWNAPGSPYFVLSLLYILIYMYNICIISGWS